MPFLLLSYWAVVSVQLPGCLSSCCFLAGGLAWSWALDWHPHCTACRTKASSLRSPHWRPGLFPPTELLPNPATTGHSLRVSPAGCAQAAGSRSIRSSLPPPWPLPLSCACSEGHPEGRLHLESQMQRRCKAVGLCHSPLSIPRFCLSSCEGGILGHFAGIQATS